MMYIIGLDRQPLKIIAGDPLTGAMVVKNSEGQKYYYDTRFIKLAFNVKGEVKRCVICKRRMRHCEHTKNIF